MLKRHFKALKKNFNGWTDSSLLINCKQCFWHGIKVKVSEGLQKYGIYKATWKKELNVFGQTF